MRKGRPKREENLETDFTNPKVPMGARDTDLGLGQAAYRALSLGLSFPI